MERMLRQLSEVTSVMTIPIAQRFGAQDVPDLRKYVANSIYMGAAMAIVITLV